LRKFDDLGAWTRAGIYLLVTFTAVALVLLIVASFPQEALGLFGAWLLLYRLLIRGRSRFDGMFKAVTAVITGASFALLAPLFSWPEVSFWFPTLAITCGLLGLIGGECGCIVVPAMMALTCLGTSFGALLWQLGVCTAATSGHSCLLAGCAMIFIVVGCTPAGTKTWNAGVITALLGALLAVESAAPQFGLLAPVQLFEVSPCPATKHSEAARATGVAWLVLAASGWVIRVVLGEPASSNSASGGQQQKQHIAPETAVVEGDRRGLRQLLVPKEGAEEESQDRYTLIRDAAMMQGCDLSHLTESERQIVEICWQDEDEKNRVVFGGGLY